MESLKQRLTELNAKREEVQNQDLDALVEAKLAELKPKIKEQAVQNQAYELKVLDIRIGAFNEALELVEAERVAEAERAEEVQEQVT
jgi:hypothetical protein